MSLERQRHRAMDALKGQTPPRFRRALVRSRLRMRLWSADWRSLPDFLIIGCQRGGTSSLYKYLGRHPQISPALRKESEYFSVNYTKGEDWYRAHFPVRWRIAASELVGGDRLVFEATPDYLLDPRAPQRARDLVPDAKLIVLLREPGARALSHYMHNMRLGLETEPFELALRLEEARLAEDLQRLTTETDNPLYSFRRYSYVTRGLYSDQVQRWLEVFPRDQFLFLESESFFADPATSLKEILRFVEAVEWSPSEFRNYSYDSRKNVAYEPVPSDVRDFLDRRFASSNETLRSLLPGTLGWLDDA
jgi:hypothetical protein